MGTDHSNSRYFCPQNELQSYCKRVSIQQECEVALVLAVALVHCSASRGALWRQTVREETLIDSLQRVADRERQSVRKPWLSSNVCD